MAKGYQDKFRYYNGVMHLLLSLTDLGLDWCEITVSESGWVSDNGAIISDLCQKMKMY